MRHLFASTVKVKRLVTTRNGSKITTAWVDQDAPLSAIPCRLDLNFLRPGKDIPLAQNAGVALERMGVMFCQSGLPLKAGDRIEAIAGPVEGTFDIKVIPDVAVAYSSAHHIEVQIVESVQDLEGKFPE